MSLPELANDELKRGIEDQESRQGSRLVISGLVSAAAVSAAIQVLAAGDGGSAAIRWAVGVLCCCSILTSVIVWVLGQTYDVDPARRYLSGIANGESRAVYLDEVLVRRLACYEANEANLRRWSVIVCYATALVSGAAAVVLSFTLLTGA